MPVHQNRNQNLKPNHTAPTNADHSSTSPTMRMNKHGSLTTLCIAFWIASSVLALNRETLVRNPL